MKNTKGRFDSSNRGRFSTRISIILIFLLVVVLGGWFALPVQAANFTVNSTSDAPDATPGNGICATAGGVCTLRAAIMEANALSGTDTITLPAGTYALTLGALPPVTEDLTITGAAAATTIIDGQSLARVFQLNVPANPNPPLNIAFSGLTIQNGKATAANLGGNGGGIYASNTNFTLNDSVVKNSTADFDGGGLYVTQSLSAALILSNTTLDQNVATRNGGAIFNDDGALDISNSNIINNSALNGGGLYQLTNGLAVINITTLASNQARGTGIAGGGGVFNEGSLYLDHSTLSNNSSGLDGGGILNHYNGTVGLGGYLEATNVTFSANTAENINGQGGGLKNESASQAILTHVTLNLNSASLGGAIYDMSDLLSLALQSIIVANSTSGNNCSYLNPPTSNGTNLDDDGTCSLAGTGDITGNPLLGVLNNNGGPTRTHALLPGSPAINTAGTPLVPVTDDQRLFPRTAPFDIGAYEVVFPGAFGKTGPANGATAQPVIITLSWGTSSQAAGYEYCIDTTNDNTCNGTWTSTVANTSVILTGLTNDTTYYWQVRAVNADGNTLADGGTWWSFTTQVALPGAFGKTSPSDGATAQPINPTLSWGTSTVAASYEYCIDTTNDSACSGTWTSTGTNTSVILTGLNNATTYYWQVRAVNAAGTTEADGGTWWSFTTQVAFPAAFGKTSPANGATAQPINPTLSWGASTGAASYEYCIDTTNDSTCSGTWTNIGASTSAALSGLNNGTTYYWQVRAINAAGNTEADSGTWWSFTTQVALPGTFGKTSPSNAATGQPTNPTLNWGASAVAASYEYCIDTTNDSTCNGTWTPNGTSTSAALSGLHNGTTYYWQVRAVNAAGNTEADVGTWWSFTTQGSRINLPLILKN